MKLYVQTGLNTGQEFCLAGNSITLGRARDNQIILSDPTVSRYHARIDRQGDAFIVSDLNSTSGTWLNGKRFTTPQWLRTGDTLRLGGVTLTVLPLAQTPVFVPPVPTQALISPTLSSSQNQLSPIGIAVGGMVGVILVCLIGVALVRMARGDGAINIAVIPTATLTVPTAVPTATSPPSPMPTITPTLTATRLPTQAPLPTATATRPFTPTPSPSPTVILPPRRLNNGTFIKQTSPRGGDGELEINNGQELDAVVVLTTLNDAPIFAVYIQARNSFKIEGINDGTYKLFFMLGEDWDNVTGRFTRKSRYQVFEDTFRYATTSTTATSWRVTLHTVVGGAAQTDSVNPSSFPSVK